MRILVNPWRETFLSLVKGAKHSIKITSPFVKNDICLEMISEKPKNTQIQLITSLKLMNAHAGYLDLMALDNILAHNGIVRNYPQLHAKIYLFDEEKAVITSGNLTYGGMIRNFEYGVLIEEENIVSKVIEDFLWLENHEKTGLVKQSDLEVMNSILAKLPTNEKERLFDKGDFSPEDNFDVLETSLEPIIQALSGWKLEVFNCINLMDNFRFSLQDLKQFEPELQMKYPQNRHVADKIRQQLQYLRDIGLIEFLGNGQYKKLWKASS